MEVGLSLGSNRGDRLLNLRGAKQRIGATPGISLIAQTPVYETEPVGVAPDDRELYFLNAVLIIESALPIVKLAARLRAIEQALGRRPHQEANAPRSIDIDIIYAGVLCFNSEQIVIPHPCWSQRRFVVRPLGDVRPDLLVPGQVGTVREVLRNLSDQHKVKLFAKEL